MTLACARCDSTYLIEDYNTETHAVAGYRCGMCGRNKFIERKDAPREDRDVKTRVSEEGDMATRNKPCSVEGCTRQGNLKDNLCYTHYHEKYGEPYRPPGEKTYDKSTVRDRGKCSVEGCGRTVYKGGLCFRCYKEAHGGPGHKLCSLDGCDKLAVRQGMCMRHWREVTGTPRKPRGGDWRKRQRNPGKELPTRGVSPLAAISGAGDFTEVAQNVLVPKDVAAIVEQVNALREGTEVKGIYSPPFENALPGLRLAHTGAQLSQEVYDMSDGNGRSGVIVFSYIDGKKVFAECRYTIKNSDHSPRTIYNFDDWMFLGDVAREIRRIQEGA